RRSMAPLTYGSTRDHSIVEAKNEGEASKLPMPWKSSSRPLGSRSWRPAADLRPPCCGSWYLRRRSRSPTPKVSPLVLPVRREAAEGGGAEGVQRHVLEAHVDGDLRRAERVGPLEEDRAERLRGALEDLQLGIEAVGESRRGGHHRDRPGRRVGDHVRERIEGRAARHSDRLRGPCQLIAQRARLDARGGQPEEDCHTNQTRGALHAAPPLVMAERGGCRASV